MESDMRTPHGRDASAMRASSCSIVGSSVRRSELTLLTVHPLSPIEASRRPYSDTRVRSCRTCPSA